MANAEENFSGLPLNTDTSGSASLGGTEIGTPVGPVTGGTYGGFPTGGSYGGFPITLGSYGGFPITGGSYGGFPTTGSGSYGGFPTVGASGPLGGPGRIGTPVGPVGTYGGFPTGGSYGGFPVTGGTYGGFPTGGSYGGFPVTGGTYGGFPAANPVATTATRPTIDGGFAGASTTGTMDAFAIKSASPETTTGSTYKIQPGDTMSGIAQKSGISLQSLENANMDISNPDLIYPGKTLNIPSATPGTSQAGATGAAADSTATAQPVVFDSNQTHNLAEANKTASEGGNTTGEQSKSPEEAMNENVAMAPKTKSSWTSKFKFF